MLTRILQEQAVAADHERQLRISAAWDAYHGKLPDSLKPTRSDPQANDNVKLNLAKLIVNKSASFLFGFQLDFEVDGERETPEEEWLGQCLDANRRMTTLHKLGINGGVTGDVFLKVQHPDAARNGHPYPRIIVWDPAGVTVRWEPDDCERIVSYTYEWHGIDPATAKPAAFRQVIERDGAGWVIRDEVSRGDQAGWVTTNEEVWGFPWAPVFHCQNLPAPNEFYGLADLEADIVGVLKALNFTASNVARILRLHAHPKTVAYGFQADQLKMGPDETLILPNPQAKVETVEMKTDLGSSLAFLARLREIAHEMGRVPEVATGKVEDLGQLSGLALQILYGPLVELTETKRLTYGELLQDLGSRLLELGGKGEGHVVKPQWPKVLPVDTKGEAETALLYEQLGASQDTLLTRVGFDPKAEAEKRKQEDERKAALAEAQMRAFDRGRGPGAGGAYPGQGQEQE